MQSNNKNKITPKFRICVLGPSYVGKTQVINRFVNNTFTAHYEPTIGCKSFRRAINVNEDDVTVEPRFVDLEIWDMFPHDHPLLNQEKELMEDDALEMEKKLDEVIKSPYTEKNDNGEEIKVINRIHAYVFVFDQSNRKTFTTMKCMAETIVELEKNKKKTGGSKKKLKKDES